MKIKCYFRLLETTVSCFLLNKSTLLSAVLNSNVTH